MNDKIIIIKQEARISKNYRVTEKNIAFLQKIATKKKANVSDVLNAILDNARKE